MSGAIRSVKKIFKKVVSVVKKVAPVVLAIAALYYTAGAAMGVKGMEGGWSAAVDTMVGKLGAGDLLTNVLGGAVKLAGYGAVGGAGLSLLTGGDALEGAQQGALYGGLTGAVGGGLGLIDSTGAASKLGGGGPVAGPGAGGLTKLDGTPLTPANLGGGGPPAPPPATTGLLSGIKDNQTLIGGAVQGIGAGISGYAEAGATKEAAQLAQEGKDREAARIASNYSGGTGAGLLTRADLAYTGNQPDRPTPGQTARFNPQPAYAGGRYVYNPTKGMVEFVAA